MLNINSVARHSSLLPLIRPLLGQEFPVCMIQLLSVYLDVSLCRSNTRMANELLSLDDVFGSLIVLSNRCCSEVVALDYHIMALVELCEHLCPLVSRVASKTSFKHDLRVSCTYIDLVSFDSIDCLLVNHD